MQPRIPAGLAMLGLALGADPACLRGADNSPNAVEKALDGYCTKHRLDRKSLQAVTLNLVPQSQVFRYRVPAIRPTAERIGVAERFVILFVDAKSGSLLEVGLMEPGRPQYRADRHGPLLREMKAKGKKVSNPKEAREILVDLMRLDDWLWSVEPSRHDPEKDLRVHGPYRSVPNSYGAVFPWSGGDDVGLQVDADGFVAKLLGGHIR